MAAERRVAGGAVWQVRVVGGGEIRLPTDGLPGGAMALVAEGATPGSRGAVVGCRREQGMLVFSVPEEARGRWLYEVPARE